MTSRSWAARRHVSQHGRHLVSTESLRKSDTGKTQYHEYLRFCLTGFDFLYQAVRRSINNTTLDWWVWMFEHTGAAARGSYTTEVRIMQNVRVIFTADPENIKAILTTQFADYGKGEPFHRDWKEFLGDSIFTTDGQQW